MTLYIQTVAQAQVAELIVAEFTGQKAARLVAELCDAFPYQCFVDCVIAIHR